MVLRGILLAATVGVFGAAPAARAADAAPRVRVETGALTGAWRGPAEVFYAIPYAAPPMGPLRWKPPAPAAPWTGERSAAAPGPACPQVVDPGGRWNGGAYAGPINEDCLTLDVTAPKGAHGAPVMVWIFGGGNTEGASNVASYDARNFARDGVIVVAMNYRLGTLGFFAHPALTAEAPTGQPLVSYGLMDQIAALAWVRRNIAAFGGDPANVTVFGESAGGEDVLDLLAIPSAWPLFNKAIVESGLGWQAPASLAQREAQGVEMAARLGLPGAAATVAQLRATPIADLIAKADPRAGPAVDGRLMRLSATEAFARDAFDRVPLIIGSNSNEASIMGPPPADPAAVLAKAPASVRAAYDGQGLAGAEIVRQMFNDKVMGAPARWIAGRASRHAPAWLYYFSYVPERQRGVRPGTNHASEIVYVFDSIDQIPGRTPQITPSERAQARLAHGCFVGFARTGRPRCPDGQAWPAYSPSTDQLLEFGDPPAVRSQFRKPQLDAQQAAAKDLIGGR